MSTEMYTTAMRHGVLSILCGLLLSILPSEECCAAPVEIGPRVHWVQVGSFTAADEAEAFAQSVGNQGISPVCLYPSGGQITVRVGEFRTMMDAHLTCEDLEETFPSATVRYNTLAEEAAEDRTWSFRPVQIPTRPHEIFNLSERPLSPDGLHLDTSLQVILDGGQVSEVTGADAASLESLGLEAFREFSPDDNEGRAAALMAIAQARAGQRDLAEAREVALPVATGEVECAPQDRLDAMLFMARLYHARNWRRTAYRAYDEIQSVVTEPADVALCMLEKTGLLLELSQSGTGFPADSRVLADELVETYGGHDDPTVRRRCATGMLIGAESHYYDDNFETCVEETRRVRSLYPDLTREWAMATLFLGNSLMLLDRDEEAVIAFQEIVSADWSADCDFPGLTTQATAAWNLSLLLERLGDPAGAASAYEYLEENYPDSWSTQNLRSQRGSI
jgi:tetratricopeptide (TPR) repeat protein